MPPPSPEFALDARSNRFRSEGWAARALTWLAVLATVTLVHVPSTFGQTPPVNPYGEPAPEDDAAPDVGEEDGQAPAAGEEDDEGQASQAGEDADAGVDGDVAEDDGDAAEGEAESDGDADQADGDADQADGDADQADGDADQADDEKSKPPVNPDAPDQVELAPIPPSDLEAAQGLPIMDMQVTGIRRIAAGDVKSYLRLKEGDSLDKEALRRDVRELWRSGFFDDIEVDLRQVPGGVSLRFHVKERPAISAVEFEGADEVSEEDLAEAIEVKVDTILSRPALGRAVQKIRDMYAEQGYFLAEASFEVIAERNNEVTVRFLIDENSQVSVRRVTFIGNEHISSKELRDVMFTGNPGILAFGSGGPFRQDAFERDIAMISAMYYDRGFLQVTVNTPRVMLTPDKTGIEVTITIDEGPRYKIRQLRVYEQGPDGTEVEPLGGRRALRLMVRGESGDYFNRAQLLQDLEQIRSMYRDEGYANVAAEPQTAVHPETKEVDVIIPVVRGPVVHFERIEVRGNTKTRDKVIRRQLEIAEGDRYSETGIERSRRRVTALGFFERVDFSTEQGSAPDQLVVYIDVSEKPTGTFQVGAGFSSIENFIATAQVQQQNLFGNGQSLSLQAQISGIRQTVNLQFVEPYFLNSRFSTSVSLFDQLRVFTDFSQRSRGGTFTIGYPLIEPEVNVSLTYNGTLDEVSTSQGSTLLGGTASRTSNFEQLPLANLFNDGVTSSFRPGISYDTRDNRLFPSSGIFLNMRTEFASDVFGSENEFIRNRWTGRFYVPMPFGVLKLNTEAGLVTSPASEGVPIFARFFLGGILDVRGFVFRSIGPRMPLTQSTDPNSAPIPNGANIGGNLMYYQNLEYEFPIFEQVGLKGVIFTDLGNAWNLEGNYCQAAGGATQFDEVNPCFSAGSLLDVRTSWGFGFRWFSPLGPLRFEWGFPFSPLPFEQPQNFQFTIGNFF